MKLRYLLLLVAASPLAAQPGNAARPRVIERGALVDPKQDDPGSPAVQMFESKNVTRFLDKAKGFLSRENYPDAIKVLQDVVEGRTSAMAAEIEAEERAKREREAKPKPAGSEAVAQPDPFEDDNPARSVVSVADDLSSDRLYRPVRRLCQEYLSQLPQAGLDLYRALFEVPAQRTLDAALAARDLAGIEQVHERWFVTRAGGKALLATADLMMDEGRFRGAFQILQTLLEVYPAKERAAVASDLALRVRMAICCQQMGEPAKTSELVALIAAGDPNATVRLLGELVPVRDLPKSPLFAVATPAPVARRGGPLALHGGREALVPLWEQRFAEAEPYKSPAASTGREGMVGFGGERAMAPAPIASNFKPGAWVEFDGDLIAFFNHFQLRVHALGTGMLAGLAKGPTTPAKPKPQTPRVRIAAYDYCSLRPVADRDRWYGIVGPERIAAGDRRPEVNNELIACDKRTLSRLWSTRETKENRLDQLSFIAAPTVFGQRLIVPILDNGAYGLCCLEAATGRQIWRTHVHGGGTELVRALTVPAVVASGTAYLLTNAGAVAAIDAYTGDLRWARKYETEHRFRPAPARVKARANPQWGAMGFFREQELSGLGPSAMLVHAGKLIFAPAEANLVLCLDGTTGEVIWMQGKPPGMRYLLGANAKCLFLAGARVSAIALDSGILLWENDVPGSMIQNRFPGRGYVTDEWIAIPDERQIQLLPADGTGAWKAVKLPAFRLQDEALKGPFNLFQQGPYVVAAYEGGIEVYGAPAALDEIAQGAVSPLERAGLLVQAGDLESATLVLESTLSGEKIDVEVAKKALNLLRDQADTMAGRGQKDAALAVLDRAQKWLVTRDLQMLWRLARIHVHDVAQDMAGVESERRELYRIAEGR